MFYAFVRAVVGLALRFFFQVTQGSRPGGGVPDSGPVLMVGNHPNGLVDPALVFCSTERTNTFLAKAPLFKLPVIGWVMRGLGALPVYRRQDDPSQMTRNEGTLDAAADALVAGRMITLFPEGKSHSEPSLGELKTGAARIALKAARRGAPVRIVPIGLTYAEKHRFRSAVRIELGEAIAVLPLLPADPADDAEAARALTERLADGLKSVTLNLDQWADLPVIELAEELYAFRTGGKAKDLERLRLFAEGLRLFRREQPERFVRVRAELVEFGRRLALVQADTGDLALQYRRWEVYRFILRNLSAMLFGFPLFVLGMVLFGLPFQVPRWFIRVKRVEWDMQATLKLLWALMLAPLWWGTLWAVSWLAFGRGWGLVTLLAVPPLALFTRYFYERRKVALHDARVFFTLGSRSRFKANLLAEGEALAGTVEALAAEYADRVAAVHG